MLNKNSKFANLHILIDSKLPQKHHWVDGVKLNWQQATQEAPL